LRQRCVQQKTIYKKGQEDFNPTIVECGFHFSKSTNICMIPFGIKEAACATASSKKHDSELVNIRLIQFLSLLKSNAALPI
jgi:hypothetical protein